MEERKDIVIYQSEDGLVKMEAMVDPSGETIWATQKAMASLFGVDKSGISRHVANIFRDGELKQEATVAKIATVVNRGIRGKIEEQVTVSWQQESEPVTNRHRLITR